MIKLRDYQQECVDSIISKLKKSIEPIVIEAATGAGKSLIVAELARWLNQIAPNKKVLCFAPSKELIEQNTAKYLLTGKRASIFCASAGNKCLNHPVIFCSPLTTKNSIDKIASMPVSAVILDEAHTLTPTILSIIDAIKVHNPNCRIIGMTATPYRMNTGYIYEIDEWGDKVHESKTKNPFFKQLVYRITAPQLIEQGFLTPPRVLDIEQSYDTSQLHKNSMGNFESDELRMIFEGSSLTQKIIESVIFAAEESKGVMIFATTVDHAKEILKLLPSGDCRLVTGDTKKSEREEIIQMFKSKMFKYMVNVSCLTTGFDAPHVDLIAVLRPTESRGLYQQIIGRGTRLNDDKEYFAIMDFAGNIERHVLHPDNMFDPEIPEIYESKNSQGEIVICPECGFQNENKIVEIKGKVISTLRRCANIMPIEGIERPILSKHFTRCTYYFKSRECDNCGSENDITARKCRKCRAVLISPDDKLSIGSGKKTTFQHDVETFEILPHHSKSGNDGFKAIINGKYTKYFATHTKRGLSEYYKAVEVTPKQILVCTAGKYPDISLIW
jgi:DNA repair protein RadD